jgi:23S rRNA (cytidine1920-2'-O)/16S rRNA (cytidine1409-2'-O)-methyltransferase
VRVNGQLIDKPGTEIALAAHIEVKAKLRFVSRGGDKLAKALALFKIDTHDRVCLDGGISTGGFTDCLLQSGAKLVYGIDVGYGQVDWRLRNDDRVVLRERTNIRYLTPAEVYGGEIDGQYASPLPDLGVVDVSFISLTKILPALWSLLAPPKEVVLLVKPQFEVGKNLVGKKGVVRDSSVQAGAIHEVLSVATALGWQYRGLCWSPITGPAGNIEYLLWLSMTSDIPPLDLVAIQSITAAANAELG